MTRLFATILLILGPIAMNAQSPKVSVIPQPLELKTGEVFSRSTPVRPFPLQKPNQNSPGSPANFPPACGKPPDIRWHCRSLV
jgi:hypothetical protein